MCLLLQDHKMKRINYNTKKQQQINTKNRWREELKKNEIKSTNSM